MVGGPEYRGPRDCGSPAGGAFVGRTVDVTKVAESAALAGFIGETFGRLDTLVNNAGVGQFVSVADMQESDYLYHYEVLVKGPMFLLKHCIPLLQKPENPASSTFPRLPPVTGCKPPSLFDGKGRNREVHLSSRSRLSGNSKQYDIAGLYRYPDLQKHGPD